MALVSIPEHVLKQPVVDELVLVDLDQGEYYTLDAVGRLILQLAEQQSCLHGLVLALQDEYEVSAIDAAGDVRALLQQMDAQGLVVLEQRL